MNEYHEQAEKFLNANGIKFRATLSDAKPPPWKNDRAQHELNDVNHHYRVTLSRGEISRTGLRPSVLEKRFTFDFWGSAADAKAGKTDIHAYEVLACISGDVNTPDTFREYCAEMGDSEDSIKALQTFRRCHNFAKRLRAFFTEQEIEQLQEIQ